MKNKMITLSIATVLFLSIFTIPLGTNHALAASKEGVVTSSTLNVREKASISSKNIGSVKKDQVVTITKQQDNWLQIQYGSKYGWVSSTYINEKKYVTASSLYLRKSNSTNSQSLATLKQGTAVQIQSIKGSWMKVYVLSNKKIGWVSTKYLSTTKPKAVVDQTDVKVERVANVEIKYVVANTLNIRESGNVNAKLITTALRGDALTLTLKNENWGKVLTKDGKIGWVSTKYLSTTKPKAIVDQKEVKVEPISDGEIKYVVNDTLNIRESGNANAKLITTALRGDALTLTTKNGNWGKVLTKDGITGWVNLTYLSSITPTKGLEGKIIVLDSGHGGKDPGAHGVRNNEKDLTLVTAKKVKEKLEVAGAKVVMTRTGDTYPSLSERVQISHNNNADVFISIHFNAGSTTATGIETYFWKTNKDETKLASLIQEELIKSTGMNDRGSDTGDFQVIRTNLNSAILVELGFISNPDEENFIETDDFQNKVATGIENGLEAYFN